MPKQKQSISSSNVLDNTPNPVASKPKKMAKVSKDSNKSHLVPLVAKGEELSRNSATLLSSNLRNKKFN